MRLSVPFGESRPSAGNNGFPRSILSKASSKSDSMCLVELFYLFDGSNNKSILIGMYFDAELIREVDVN